ncbi:MAG: apolipoprotein N-acyltransferase [Acidobacteriota bacterium]|nr:MAG: apolipoprotein N-acyltransferase [Acidobacteriota bacterium]
MTILPPDEQAGSGPLSPEPIAGGHAVVRLRRSRGPVRAVLATLAGAGWAVAFPEPGWWPLLLPSLAVWFGLLATARPARAAWESFLVGFVFFGLLLRWFAAVIIDFTSLGGVVAAGAVLAPAVLLGALLAGVGWVAARCGRGGALLAIVPLCVGFELVREVFPAPFPWGALCAPLARRPEALALARSLGSAGVSLCVAGAAAALSAGLLRVRGWRVGAAAWFAVVCAGAGAGWWLTPRAGENVRVAVVQGSTAREAASSDMLATYLQLTRQAAASDVRLVLWPESACRYRIDAHEEYRAFLERTCARYEFDLLLGSVTRGDAGEWFNSVALVRADAGLSTVGSKQVLVPFGEYLPLRPLLGEIPALAAEAGDFSAGVETVIHPSAAGPVGALVCYESVFPGHAARLARRGAVLLVNLTNDSWFGWTSGPAQHLHHGLLRAAETRRPLLRAANSGISAIVDAKGRVVSELALGERGVLVGDVATEPLYPVGAVLGRALSWACAILSVALVVFASIRGRAGSERPRSASSHVASGPSRPASSV